ncbi:uncharacterized protein [Narcine bancroftii]|uniref:uncharacterized protein isoform X3 n=1 Tax=Narcine bancroftii TaxID=1343680 RepID=UPI003831C736
MSTSPGTASPGRAGALPLCVSTTSEMLRTPLTPWMGQSSTAGSSGCRWPAIPGPRTRIGEEGARATGGPVGTGAAGVPDGDDVPVPAPVPGRVPAAPTPVPVPAPSRGPGERASHGAGCPVLVPALSPPPVPAPVPVPALSHPLRYRPGLRGPLVPVPVPALLPSPPQAPALALHPQPPRSPPRLSTGPPRSRPARTLPRQRRSTHPPLSPPLPPPLSQLRPDPRRQHRRGTMTRGKGTHHLNPTRPPRPSDGCGGPGLWAASWLGWSSMEES